MLSSGVADILTPILEVFPLSSSVFDDIESGGLFLSMSVGFSLVLLLRFFRCLFVPVGKTGLHKDLKFPTGIQLGVLKF